MRIQGAQTWLTMRFFLCPSWKRSISALLYGSYGFLPASYIALIFHISYVVAAHRSHIAAWAEATFHRLQRDRAPPCDVWLTRHPLSFLQSAKL